jgi:hypothetical protein
VSTLIKSTGTPIRVAARHGRGVTIWQGSSKVMLSHAEIGSLIEALSGYLTPDAQCHNNIPQNES